MRILCYLFGVHRTVYCAQVERPVYVQRIELRSRAISQTLRQSGVDAGQWLARLKKQQDTICQMDEYNRLLSSQVATYASETNRLKALVAKLQRMQFGKSSEKLRAKIER